MTKSKSLDPDIMSQFTGSEHWYRHALVRRITFTDGVKYVADAAGASWLLDVELDLLDEDDIIIAVLGEGGGRVGIHVQLLTNATKSFGLSVKPRRQASLTLRRCRYVAIPGEA